MSNLYIKKRSWHFRSLCDSSYQATVRMGHATPTGYVTMVIVSQLLWLFITVMISGVIVLGFDLLTDWNDRIIFLIFGVSNTMIYAAMLAGMFYSEEKVKIEDAKTK